MIILASNSIGRRTLFEKAKLDFKVVASNIDESTVDKNIEPSLYVTKLSTLKAEHIIKQYPNDIIVAADTVVIFENKLIGKPKDLEDAKNILQAFSNKTHQIYTGVCILYQDLRFEFFDVALVTFNELTDRMIKKYVETKDPLGKAGAYGIQNIKQQFVKSIEGDINTVIGIPLDKVLKIINQIIN